MPLWMICTLAATTLLGALVALLTWNRRKWRSGAAALARMVEMVRLDGHREEVVAQVLPAIRKLTGALLGVPPDNIEVQGRIGTPVAKRSIRHVRLRLFGEAARLASPADVARLERAVKAHCAPWAPFDIVLDQGAAR